MTTEKLLHHLSPAKYSKIHHQFKSKSKHYKTPIINQVPKSKFNSKRKFFKKHNHISQSHNSTTIEGDG